MSHTCIICGDETEVTAHTEYGDWACAKCGQQYEYNEGHGIVLSAAQRSLLICHWLEGQAFTSQARNEWEEEKRYSPLEQRLQGENDQLRRENDQLLESIKQQSFIVPPGATFVCPSHITQIGHLFVTGGTVMQEQLDRSITYGLEKRDAEHPCSGQDK